MTFNELAYSLADLRGMSNDSILIERIKFNILLWRERLLRRSDERTFRLAPQLLQTIGTTPVSESGLYRSAVPRLVELKSGPAIQSLRSMTQSIELPPYGYCGSIEEMRVLGRNGVTKTSGRYCLEDDTLWLNKPDPVSLKGVFFDPRTVLESKGVFDTDNVQFPITGELASAITQSMMSGELQPVPTKAQEVALHG